VFGSLTDKFQVIFQRIRNRGKLSEEDIKKCLHEIRIALLEADVNYKVVKEFIENLSGKLQEAQISASLTPTQQIIKIVYEEITKILGEKQVNANFHTTQFNMTLLVGLQGTGKTTTAVKLAHYWKEKGYKPLLIAADMQRPAAIEQLKILGDKSKISVFSPGGSESAISTIERAIKYATQKDFNLLIIDTAGRLHIDYYLMNELKLIEQKFLPQESLLVVDAMAGQDALNSAKIFCDTIKITGIVLTKLDGDSRGGVALSLKKVLGIPIKFVGLGEKIDNIQVFHPERMATRILGMGDVLTLIEKAEAVYDPKEIKKLGQKIKDNDFDLNDFYLQIKKIKNIGSFDQVLAMIPGFNLMKNRIPFNNVPEGEIELKKIEAIISSMTVEERENPNIINGSRRKRIAQGSGTQICEVNRLLKQFSKMKELLKKGPDLSNIPFLG